MRNPPKNKSCQRTVKSSPDSPVLPSLPSEMGMGECQRPSSTPGEDNPGPIFLFIGPPEAAYRQT